MENVEQFIEQLLVDKGITGLEPEIRQELVEDMKGQLLDQIDKVAIMQLSEEKAEELNTKLDDPEFTNEKMAAFLQEAGVDLAQVTLNTMMQFRNFYLTTEG